MREHKIGDWDGRVDATLLSATGPYLVFIRSREAAIALGNISDIRVIVPLLDTLGGGDSSVQQGATTGLKKACSLIHVIVFGNRSGSRFDPHHTVCNPDVSHVTVPMFRLKCVIIETESYHFVQVEQFITYAVNVIG